MAVLNVIAAMVLPWFLLPYGYAGPIQYLYLVLLAPEMTFGLLGGRLDGEAYAKGFVWLAAMG